MQLEADEGLCNGCEVEYSFVVGHDPGYCQKCLYEIRAVARAKVREKRRERTAEHQRSVGETRLHMEKWQTQIEERIKKRTELRRVSREATGKRFAIVLMSEDAGEET